MNSASSTSVTTDEWVTDPTDGLKKEHDVQPKKSTCASGFSIPVFVVLLLGIAVHDYFLFEAGLAGMDFWGIQWIIFCVFNALVPATGLMYVLMNSLLMRGIFRTISIVAFCNSITYLAIGCFAILDLRRNTIIAVSSIGLLSSLIHFFGVEKFIRKEDLSQQVVSSDIEDGL
jgi:hypothetical protein